MTKFYEELAEILDVDKVDQDDHLRDFEDWDSLTVMSVLAMADSIYGVTIWPEELKSATTAGDLASLIEGKRG
jgi:acyl carrier protein